MSIDKSNFQGSIPAIPTPFYEDKIDWFAFEKILLRSSRNAKAVVVTGSTGEGTSLSESEYSKIIKRAKELIDHQTTLIAGISSATTRNAVYSAKAAKNSGADALLISTPYYLRPTENGICRHYEKISLETSLPIILYNVPSRTTCNTSIASISKLYKSNIIFGIKEAGENTERVSDIINQTGTHFLVLCGDDSAAYEMRKFGAHGCISVTANIAPEICERAHSLFSKGLLDDAKTQFSLLADVQAALMLEPNPQGLKYALHLLGLCHPECRLPLISASSNTANHIALAIQKLKNHGYISPLT